jgi:hypothetical protein
MTIALMINPKNAWSLEQLITSAQSAIVSIGKPAVAVLIEKLTDNEEYVVYRAVRMLSQIGPDAVEAESALSRIAGDSSSSSQREAERALKKITQNQARRDQEVQGSRSTFEKLQEATAEGARTRPADTITYGRLNQGSWGNFGLDNGILDSNFSELSEAERELAVRFGTKVRREGDSSILWDNSRLTTMTVEHRDDGGRDLLIGTQPLVSISREDLMRARVSDANQKMNLSQTSSTPGDVLDIGNYIEAILESAKPMNVKFAFEKGTKVTDRDKKELNKLIELVRVLTKDKVTFTCEFNKTKPEIADLKNRNKDAEVVAILAKDSLLGVTSKEVQSLAGNAVVAVEEDVDYAMVMLGLFELLQNDRQAAVETAKSSLLIQRLFKEISIFLRDVRSLEEDSGEDELWGIELIRNHSVSIRAKDQIGRAIISYLATRHMA